jgi:hypothetical protein
MLVSIQTVLFSVAQAHHWHGHDVTVNIDNTTEVIEIVETRILSDSDIAELVAKGSACDHSFYWGKQGKWQISPQAAYYDGELEMCIGAAYRPEDTNVMFNLSIVPDEDTDEIIIQGGALIVLDD